MGSKLRIVLVSKNHELCSQMELRLQSKRYQAVTFSSISRVLGFINADPPDIVIIDLLDSDTETQKFIKEIKKDSYFSVIPVIGILGEDMDEIFDRVNHPLDDFISLPVKYADLFSRISISMQRMQRVFVKKSHESCYVVD